MKDIVYLIVIGLIVFCMHNQYKVNLSLTEKIVGIEAELGTVHLVLMGSKFVPKDPHGDRIKKYLSEYIKK